MIANIKKQYKLLIGIAVFVALLIWLASSYVNRPPAKLGAHLEYVGSVNVGCSLICDTRPGATYYYATDLTLQELLKTFTLNCTVSEPGSGDFVAAPVFCGTEGKGGFGMDFYIDDAKSVVEHFSLKQTSRRFIIDFSKEDLGNIKAALK